MVGPSAMPRKSKRKQLALSFEESDVEYSSSLKEILIEPEQIYRHTRTRTGAITLIDYDSFAKGIESNDKHPAIAESHLSNFSMEREACTYMTNTPEKIVRRFKEQPRVQKAQQEMLQAQQESINDLKKMIVLFT